MIHLFGTAALLVGAVAAMLFCVLYHLSARWWTSEEGWHLMSFTGAFALILSYSAFRTLTAMPRPASLGVEIIRLAIFGSVGLLLVWRLWMLIRIQIKPRKRR